jgi:hypothetical protein
MQGIYNGACPQTPSTGEVTEVGYDAKYGDGANHEVVVVGYDGRAGPGGAGSFFKVKNSWGEGCGNAGYFSLAMLPDHGGTLGGMCGMYYSPAAPLDVM